jgi:hypothetical protein
MIKADTLAAAEAGMILAMGVRSHPTTRDLVASIERRGLECAACQRNVIEDGDQPDDHDWRDAAGVGLCQPCYTEAGIENEHADGHHDGAPAPDCWQCDESAEDYNAGPESCPHSFGVHDCVLDAGHEGAHECDDECDRECSL